MPSLKTFEDIELPNNECWRVVTRLAWNDNNPWDWTTGVPPGLTAEDEAIYTVYSVVPRVRYVLSLLVDRDTITDALVAYYSQGSFLKSEVKMKSVPGEFAVPTIPDGAVLFNTKGFAIAYGDSISVPLVLTLDYTGPTSIVPILNPT